MQRLFCALVVISLCIPGNATESTLPGSVDYGFKIVNIYTGGKESTQFSFEAEVLEPNSWIDKACTRVAVSGSFDQKKWASKGGVIDLEKHQSAIKTLIAASSAGGPIRFGVVQAGLYRSKPCTYLSKGLVGQGGIVYSVYSKLKNIDGR